jgi:hypothetical protein
VGGAYEAGELSVWIHDPAAALRSRAEAPSTGRVVICTDRIMLCTAVLVRTWQNAALDHAGDVGLHPSHRVVDDGTSGQSGGELRYGAGSGWNITPLCSAHARCVETSQLTAPPQQPGGRPPFLRAAP